MREEEFEALLPLIAAYQRFYEVDEIDDERNRFFFRRFLAPSEDGHAARRRATRAACPRLRLPLLALLLARRVETVLMNDLFVAPEARGRGIGRALIEASADVARERGARLARVGHRARQPHRPAPLRLD